MLRFSSSVSSRFASNASRVARKLQSNQWGSSATLHHPIPATNPSNLQSLNNINFNTVYTTTKSAVVAAWRSLLPTTTNSLSRQVARASMSRSAVSSRPLAQRALKGHYRQASSASWDAVMKTKRRAGPVWYLKRGVREIIKLGALAMNAAAVWHLHSDLHRDNPTFVSYLAFVPLLDWLPMLDLAGLDRAWILLPVGAMAFMYAGMPYVPVNIISLIALALPFYGFELYRNYHILGHFEQRNYLTLGLWTVMFRLKWLFTSQLAILGTERYQLVPHTQNSIFQTASQTADRLDASLLNPDLIHPHNYPFLFFSWLWEKGLRRLREPIGGIIDDSGIEKICVELGLSPSPPEAPALENSATSTDK